MGTSSSSSLVDPSSGVVTLRVDEELLNKFIRGTSSLEEDLFVEVEASVDRRVLDSEIAGDVVQRQGQVGDRAAELLLDFAAPVGVLLAVINKAVVCLEDVLHFGEETVHVGALGPPVHVHGDGRVVAADSGLKGVGPGSDHSRVFVDFVDLFVVLKLISSLLQVGDLFLR